MARLIIISNRLPVSVVRNGESFDFKSSVGGLATGLSSIGQSTYETIWIGWPGIANESINLDEKEK